MAARMVVVSSALGSSALLASTSCTSSSSTGGTGGTGGTSSQSAQVVSCSTSTPAQTVAAVGDVTSFHFSPADVTVSVGDVVRFSNQTNTVHTSTSGRGGVNPAPDGKWNTGSISPGQSACVKFLIAGSYPFYCSFHPTMMTGTVTVQSGD